MSALFESFMRAGASQSPAVVLFLAFAGCGGKESSQPRDAGAADASAATDAAAADAAGVPDAALQPATLDLHVDGAQAHASPDGSAALPFRTISAAVARARQLRGSGETRPLRVRVAVGTYGGIYPEDTVEDRAGLEPLPIVLNVDDLEIAGATRLPLDVRGVPIDTPMDATTLIKAGEPFTWRDRGDPAFFYIEADSVTVSGLVMDSRHPDTGAHVNDGVAIIMKRSTDYQLRGNVFRSGFGALDILASSGRIVGNVLVDAYNAEAFFGDAGAHHIEANRIDARGDATNEEEGEGLELFRFYGDFPVDPGDQATSIPTPEYDRFARAAETLSVNIVNNEISHNGESTGFSAGIFVSTNDNSTHRAMAQRPAATYVARVSARISRNRFHDNHAFGILVSRNASHGSGEEAPKAYSYETFAATTLSYDLDLDLMGNDFSGNPLADLMVSMVHESHCRPENAILVDLAEQKHLEASRFDITFDEASLPSRLSLIHPRYRPRVGAKLSDAPLQYEVSEDASDPLDNVVTLNGQPAAYTTYSSSGYSSGLTYHPIGCLPASP